MKLFLACLFIITVPVWSVCLSLRFSYFDSAYLKQSLKDQGTYAKLADVLINQVNASLKADSKDNPLKLLQPFIKKELDATYFQIKIDQVIDDTEAWVSGRSDSPPRISFTDLKEKLIRQNPNILTQLQNLEKEYKKNKPYLQEALAQAQREDPTLASTTLPDINLATWLHEDPVIELKNYVVWLKPLYFLAHAGIYIFGGLLLFSIGGLLFLSSPPLAGLKSIGITLLAAAGGNYLIYLMASRIVPTLTNFFPSQVKNIDVSSYLPTTVGSLFIHSFARIFPLVSLAFLIVGGVTLAADVPVSKRKLK